MSVLPALLEDDENNMLGILGNSTAVACLPRRAPHSAGREIGCAGTADTVCTRTEYNIVDGNEGTAVISSE